MSVLSGILANMSGLFIGNLSFASYPSSVALMFLSAGWVISVDIPQDRVTRRSKCFGFVDMADARAANQAASTLDGAELDGRSIFVNLARTREGAGAFRRSPVDHWDPLDRDVERWVALANAHVVKSLSAPEPGYEPATPAADQPPPELLVPSSGLFIPGEDWRLPVRWTGRISVTSFVDQRLMAELAADRSRLLRLEARAFEELIAELLARLGATGVRLMPGGHDRGVDIWATAGGSGGETLCAVQCKRYAPPGKVGQPVLQHLWAVPHTSQASVVAVVTTASFTRDAFAYQSEVGARLALHDGDAVSAWLDACRKPVRPRLALGG